MPEIAIPGVATAPVLEAHLAVPPVGEGPWPAVVVLHEAFGLTDGIRQISDRFASAGYLAVAPDLFTAGGAWRCIRSTFRSLMAGEGKAFDDIEAVRLWVADRDDCTGRVGVGGFCMGGGFALVAASRGFNASAPNYGMLPKNPNEALRGACPVVASYGAKDRALKGTAPKLARSLATLGVEHDVKEYPDAGHSFLNRHNLGPFSALERVAGLGYHQPSAEDAWDRILRFFDRHLR